MPEENVELKARLHDPGQALAQALELGAEDRGMLHQRDTYFRARHGRLKLREIEGSGSELIAYRRPDTIEAELSAYEITPIQAAASTKEALAQALGISVVVAKRRRLLIWQGVRIHLDEVENLGSFIEFEAVIGPAGGLAEAHAKVAQLRARLGIEDADLIAVGYSDLLLDGPAALMAAAQQAMHNAYAPYSKFKVGAAIRTTTGSIYAAANVENAAFPQSQCAEASAVGAMVAAGETQIAAVAVVSEQLEHCPPCGGCRQRLREFAGLDVSVYLGRPGDTPYETTLGDLLPMSFGPEAL